MREASPTTVFLQCLIRSKHKNFVVVPKEYTISSDKVKIGPYFCESDEYTDRWDVTTPNFETDGSLEVCWMFRIENVSKYMYASAFACVIDREKETMDSCSSLLRLLLVRRNVVGTTHSHLFRRRMKDNVCTCRITCR